MHSSYHQFLSIKTFPLEDPIRNYNWKIISFVYIMGSVSCLPIHLQKNKSLSVQVKDKSSISSKAFTNCVHDYDRAHNMHTKDASHTKKFVHGVCSSL